MSKNYDKVFDKIAGEDYINKSVEILNSTYETSDVNLCQLKSPDVILQEILNKCSDYIDKEREVMKQTVLDSMLLNKYSVVPMTDDDEQMDLALLEELEQSGVDIEEITDNDIRVMANQVRIKWIANPSKVKEFPVGSTGKRYRRKSKKVFFLVALLSILMLGATLVTQGSKAIEIITNVRNEGNKLVIEQRGQEKGSDEGNTTLYIENNIQQEEFNAYQRLKDELGILPIMLTYKPEGMVFDDLIIQDALNTSIILFKYKDYKVYLRHEIGKSEFVTDIIAMGIYVESYDSKTLNHKMDVYEIFNEEYNKNMYLAMYTVDNRSYVIHAMIEKEEFIKIVEGIQYFKSISY